MQESNRKSLLLRMPVLPLRGMMVFPHMVLHFDVGRPKERGRAGEGHDGRSAHLSGGTDGC